MVAIEYTLPNLEKPRSVSTGITSSPTVIEWFSWEATWKHSPWISSNGETNGCKKLSLDKDSESMCQTFRQTKTKHWRTFKVNHSFESLWQKYIRSNVFESSMKLFAPVPFKNTLSPYNLISDRKSELKIIIWPLDWLYTVKLK